MKNKIDPKKVEYDGRSIRLIINDEKALIKDLKKRAKAIIKDLKKNKYEK